MNIAASVSGFSVWLLLTTLGCHAASSENHHSVLESITKLTEHVSQLSDQITRISNQQSEHTDELDKIKDELVKVTDRLNSADESSAGPTFVRWGKRSCNGTGSEMVYFGVTAGTCDINVGGGANLLCLPRNPTFGNKDDTDHPEGVEVFVAEYQLDPTTNFPFEHNDPLLLDHDVPCAVCEVTNGSSVMMIPARVDCYSDWKMEYRGYLMAERIDSLRGEFVCVDANPEPDYSGAGPAIHKHGLYPVQANGANPSLPSPPYYDNWELACVVCSK